MTLSGWIQITLFSIILLLLTKPMGLYMVQVIEGSGGPLSRLLGPFERMCYRIVGIDSEEEMRWTDYTLAILVFSLVGALLTYALLRMQGILPLNPMGFSTASAPAYATNLTADLAFNTAMSFTTNTNWQNYSGESTMSYLSQMLALAYHNWTSAAVGLAACTALVRGFSRHSVNTVGNFWKDLVRTSLYILLPILFVYSIFLVWQGVIQNIAPYTVAKTIEGASQIIPQGPVASQEAIKMLGINGGGIFNANSAHPFENPTPLSNFVQMLSIFILPAGLTYMFGKMVRDTRQGWALFAAMYSLFIIGVAVCYYYESRGNPNFNVQHVETSTHVLGDLGGNMEGKEVRFGLADSSLFAVVTTDASCGAVNCMHDSFTPLGGMIPLLNIQLGEIVFGGVGSGLYGMLVFAVLTVFIAGLMVGRTPEYVGKKIEQKDVKMAMLFVLAGCFSILIFTALASVLELPVKSPLNQPGSTFNNVNNGGPHGFSEILYCFTSCTGNNGSAFGGLTGNTAFYNVTAAFAMLIGRFFMMIPALSLAGSLVQKKYVPPSTGTFPTHSWLFVVLLIGVILIVGALTFFPALTLGPIIEHFLMKSGKLF
ncbi:MAG: potassium-transporting ATPase subunit KdpA [Candidatus Melainabacteria bacterium]|nr:MAG: potassium-transporting ATPase subunit KdpA [Candidatus Melainabacteria bacterium]